CRVRCGHVLGVVQLVQAAVAHQLHGAHGGWNRHRGLSSPRNTRTRDAADEDRLACRSVMRLWGPPPAGRRPVDSGWEHECDTLAWALRRMLTKGSGGPALIAEAPGAWRIPVPAGMARRVRPPSTVRRRLLFSSPRQRLAEPPGSHRPAVLRRG